MPKKAPDPLTRRYLREKELPPAQSLAYAEAYLAEGRNVEALDFLAKADAHEQIAALRAEALASGDFFLMRAAERAGAEPPGREEWLALAEAAEAAGKALYAAAARRQLDRGAE